MDRSRYAAGPDLWLDARRAVWLPEQRVLAVADLHLGYAWCHRQAGQLMPVNVREDAGERLERLVDEYEPLEVALLGDIVHRALPLPALEDELCGMIRALSAKVRLRLVAGNHDANLSRLLARLCLDTEVCGSIDVGPHVLLHGDVRDAAAATALRKRAEANGGRLIFGHEHPAVRLSDRVASAVRCPCFLVSTRAVVLPAFSTWAAGCEVGRAPFLSALTQQESWEQAVAIMGTRLLPIPWKMLPGV